MRIFLCGHGGWSPADGYAKVPARSSLTFYTQNVKLLKGGDDYAVIQGTFWGQPDSVIRAFHWACCRHVAMKREVGGEALGFNLVEEKTKYTKYDYDAGVYNTVMPRK